MSLLQLKKKTNTYGTWKKTNRREGRDKIKLKTNKERRKRKLGVLQPRNVFPFQLAFFFILIELLSRYKKIPLPINDKCFFCNCSDMRTLQ